MCYTLCFSENDIDRTNNTCLMRNCLNHKIIYVLSPWIEDHLSRIFCSFTPLIFAHAIHRTCIICLVYGTEAEFNCRWTSCQIQHLFWTGWSERPPEWPDHQQLVPAIPRDGQLPDVWLTWFSRKWKFRYDWKGDRKVTPEVVCLSCCEAAAVHIHDHSWKEMKVKMMTMRTTTRMTVTVTTTTVTMTMTTTAKITMTKTTTTTITMTMTMTTITMTMPMTITVTLTMTTTTTTTTTMMMMLMMFALAGVRRNMKVTRYDNNDLWEIKWAEGSQKNISQIAALIVYCLSIDGCSLEYVEMHFQWRYSACRHINSISITWLFREGSITKYQFTCAFSFTFTFQYSNCLIVDHYSQE